MEPQAGSPLDASISVWPILIPKSLDKGYETDYNIVSVSVNEDANRR